MKLIGQARAKPPPVTIVLSIAIVALLAYIVYAILSRSGTSTHNAYFTTDDGATVFVDSLDRLPPFDHNGKPAYRMWMFSADEGKTRFPGYMERCTPQGKARMEAALADFKAGKTRVPPDLVPSDLEIKKPGSENPWVSRANGQEASKIIKSQMPAGKEVEIELP